MRNAGTKKLQPGSGGWLRRDKKKKKNIAPCGAYSLLLHSIFMYIPYLVKSATSGHINQTGLIDKNQAHASNF